MIRQADAARGRFQIRLAELRQSGVTSEQLGPAVKPPHAGEQAPGDLYLHPEQAHELLERILAFHVAVARNLGRRFAGRIDGLIVSDDRGTGRSTLIEERAIQVVPTELSRRSLICSALIRRS